MYSSMKYKEHSFIRKLFIILKKEVSENLILKQTFSLNSHWGSKCFFPTRFAGTASVLDLGENYQTPLTS